MNIGANIPDRVKTELNLAISEAARIYQKENDRYFSRNRILDVETMMKLNRLQSLLVRTKKQTTYCQHLPFRLH